jgi:hypothetical protein
MLTIQHQAVALLCILLVLITQIYHDARSTEYQISQERPRCMQLDAQNVTYLHFRTFNDHVYFARAPSLTNA